MDLRMASNVVDVLGVSDFMMRVYVPLTQEEPNKDVSIQVYVGYYASQRTGSTYHSPRNCLPGSGWQLIEAQEVKLGVGGDRDITVNHVLAQKGLDRLVILYWYMDRGRVIASEYYAKAYLLWDAVTMNRTDGSLVRISVPVTSSAERAYGYGTEFLRNFFPLLEEHYSSGKARKLERSGRSKAGGSGS
jgi:EpsI family protein